MSLTSQNSESLYWRIDYPRMIECGFSFEGYIG